MTVLTAFFHSCHAGATFPTKKNKTKKKKIIKKTIFPLMFFLFDNHVIKR